MNNEQKNGKKPDESGMGKIIAFIVALVILCGASGGSGMAALIIIVAVIGIVVFIGMNVAKPGKSDAQGQDAQPQQSYRPQAQREFTPKHFDMSKFVGNSGKSLSKRLTEKMQDDLTRCDDDHEHIEPDFAADPSEKRASQLKEMLRNGIIEKDEYNILMRKYGLK